METWLNELAATLGTEPATSEEIEDLLSVARDVAHAVERKATPIATFLLGVSVQAHVASGATPADALSEAISELRRSLPPVEP